jgi:ferredoxin
VPLIVFLENDLGRRKSVDAPEGGDLLDLCDQILAPVPFSCRSASCATCQIEIVEGVQLLEPPAREETELLELLGRRAEIRLACQARVRAGAGTIRIKPVGM